jgi:hypothetical protein
MAMNAGGFMAGSIVAKMFLDSSGWKASVDQIKKDEVTIKTSAQKIGQSLTRAFTFAAAAGTAIVGSLALIVKKTADTGDAFNDMSKRVGISVEQLSAYDLIAKKSGTSMEGLAVAFRGLSSRMLDASRGLEAQKATFDELGISVTDGSGKLRSMDDVLLDVADRFSKMEDGTRKAALAQDLFGRSGMELIPMLNEGRAAILANVEAARRLGLVWSKEDAAAADNLHDSLAELSGSVRGIASDIGKALIPVFTTMAQGATEGIANIRKHVAKLAEDGTLREWAIGLGKTFILVFRGMAMAVEGFLLIWGSFKSAVFLGASVIAEKLSMLLVQTLTLLMAAQKVFPGLKGITGDLLSVLRDVEIVRKSFADTADTTIEKTTDIAASFEVLYKELDKLGASLSKAPVQISGIGEAAKKNLPPVVDVLKGIAKGAAEAETAFDSLLKLMGPNWGKPFHFGDAAFKSWTPEEWDKDLEESFRLIREKAAETGKETKKAVDNTAHYFDGLFNDMAMGFGDALEGMFDGTKTFAEGFTAIWTSIKKTFFRILGEMVAGFIINFVKKLASGMKLLDALSGALGLGKIVGAVASGTGAVVAGAGAAAGAGTIITNTGAIAAGASGASASLIAGYAAPIAFAALWLGTLFGKIFGKSAFEKWTEEYTRRMNQRFGVGGWSFMEGPLSINQLKDPGHSYAVPSTWSGKRRSTTPTGSVRPASGDINLNVTIHAVDGADVDRIVRNKIIPRLREAARHREFTIPVGAVGGA